MNKPVKILMVCLGNICRSPLAQGILTQKSFKYDLNLIVDSCGTSDFHVGDPPDSRTIENAKKHNLDITNLRGRQFHPNDFDNFDAIFAMDKANYRSLMSFAKKEEDKRKIRLLLSLIFDEDAENISVPDPYYGGEEGFEKVYQLIDAACEKLAKNYAKLIV